MNTETKHIKSERYLIGVLAITSGITLLYLAILGPLVLDRISYKTSASAYTQTMAQDIVNIILLAPLSIIGGISHIMRKSFSKYLLILTPIYLMYMGLSYGIGMEWSYDLYTGSSEQYFFNYLTLIVGGLIVMIASLSMFSEEDAPEFNKKSLKIYISMTTLFLLLFAKMWIDEVQMVIQTGDTISGSYSSTPTLFWVIRYLDLGFSIPLGLIGMYLLATRPKTSYPIIQLVYGFFITMVSAVLTMGVLMFLENDPEVQLSGIILFAILFVLSYSGYYYLIKHKLRGE